MGVKAFGGGDACVAELLWHRDDICTICQEYWCHGMPESVGIDVGWIVPKGEITQPISSQPFRRDAYSIVETEQMFYNYYT